MVLIGGAKSSLSLLFLLTVDGPRDRMLIGWKALKRMMEVQ